MTNLEKSNNQVFEIIINYITPIIGSEKVGIVLNETFRYGISRYHQKNQILTDLVDSLTEDAGISEAEAQSIYDQLRSWSLMWEGIELYGSVLAATAALSEYEDQMAVADLALGRYQESLQNVGSL